MPFKNIFARLLIPLILGIIVVSVSWAVTIPKRPTNYVVDLANIVDNSTEARINAYLKELEQKTSSQLVILTITSLEGESIEDLSINLAHDQWKLGQKGKDNGVLFVISLKDRKYRIEVGYGLEGVLPDSLVGSIGRQILVPYFKKGNFSNGIFAATLAMANEIATDAGVQVSGMPTLKRSGPPAKQSQPPGLMQTVMTILFVIIMVILFIKNPRLFLLLFLFSSMGGRGGSWGGGSGGFGGGGGGGFGGGGSSGGW
jgi:uncharacterized protein